MAHLGRSHSDSTPRQLGKNMMVCQMLAPYLVINKIDFTYGSHILTSGYGIRLCVGFFDHIAVFGFW